MRDGRSYTFKPSIWCPPITRNTIFTQGEKNFILNSFEVMASFRLHFNTDNSPVFESYDVGPTFSPAFPTIAQQQVPKPCLYWIPRPFRILICTAIYSRRNSFSSHWNLLIYIIAKVLQQCNLLPVMPHPEVLAPAPLWGLSTLLSPPWWKALKKQSPRLMPGASLLWVKGLG